MTITCSRSISNVPNYIVGAQTKRTQDRGNGQRKKAKGTEGKAAAGNQMIWATIKGMYANVFIYKYRLH